MPAVEVVRPLKVNAPGSSELRIVNRGPNTIFYGETPTVSEAENLGTLAEAEALTITGPHPVFLINKEAIAGEKQKTAIVDFEENEVIGTGEGVSQAELEAVLAAAEAASIPRFEKGKPFGVAELDGSGFVPDAQLRLVGVSLEQVEEVASPLAGEFPGFTVHVNMEGLPSLEAVSNWGISEEVPYYDSEGASAKEAAALSIDPNSGEPVLTLIAGQE